MAKTAVAQKPVWVKDQVWVERPTLRDRLQQKGFGEREGKKLVLDLAEALYLMEKGKIEVVDLRGRAVSFEQLLRAGKKSNKNYNSHYTVFKDMREKGYVVKTGFKFGFAFRVYPKGKKPGQTHTKWVVTVAQQNEKWPLSDVSAKVRLSGTIKTVFLQAVVDAENSVSYFEVKRLVP